LPAIAFKEKFARTTEEITSFQNYSVYKLKKIDGRALLYCLRTAAVLKCQLP